MSKAFKKILVLVCILFASLLLAGCEMLSGGSSANTAKLDSDKQGFYYGDDVVVEVRESKVLVTDPSGKTLEYKLYEEDGKIYFKEDDKRVYCTFGDGTVTNEKGTFVKRDSDTVAKMEADKQGLYYGDDVIVEVLESKVKITDPSGKTLEYVLYDDGKIYIKEDGEKVYCTFGEGTVTNIHGTFSKNGTTNIKASINEAKQGIYSNGSVEIWVYASRVEVYDGSGKMVEYNLYQDSDGIYFIENEEKAYCTFGEGTVTNIHGTFTKDDSSTLREVDSGRAAQDVIDLLNLEFTLRIPKGTRITEALSEGESTTSYIIRITNSGEDFNSYLEYVKPYFENAGFMFNSPGSFMKMGPDAVLGFSVTYDEESSSLLVIALKINTGE